MRPSGKSLNALKGDPTHKLTKRCNQNRSSESIPQESRATRSERRQKISLWTTVRSAMEGKPKEKEEQNNDHQKKYMQRK